MACRCRGRVLASFVLCVAAQATLADPFLVRDQNPLLRGVYLPVSRPAMMPDRSWTQDFTLTVSNTTNIESRNGAQLLVDGESTELRWIGNWRLSRHWQVQLSVPFVHYGGGQLDSFIDDWHRLLGLPRGDRPRVPRTSSSSRITARTARGSTSRTATLASRTHRWRSPTR